jgi:hypothetical protein
MELPVVHPVGLAPPMKSRLWWCAWQKRTGIVAFGKAWKGRN